jgi:hypothetical protein
MGLASSLNLLLKLDRELAIQRVLSARPMVATIRASREPRRFRDVEFKCFSQFGDDGIIQYLVHILDIDEQVFVEFGVEDYKESNTRFLLVNDNWRGLVIDGSEENMAALRREPEYWRHDLQAVASFVDRDNINGIIRGAGISGDIGILSVDIDGNDYWVWQAIDCVRPVLAICEYNSVFGSDRAISIPYDPGFMRTKAHHSYLYFGASLAALTHLANEKGYELVGCNTAGNNAYFVRRDRLGPLTPLDAKQGYIESRYREARTPQGELAFTRGADRLGLIRGLPVVNVLTGASETL